MIDIIGYVSAGIVIAVGGVACAVFTLFIFFTIIKAMLEVWK